MPPDATLRTIAAPVMHWNVAEAAMPLRGVRTGASGGSAQRCAELPAVSCRVAPIRNIRFVAY
jgi:hypothetical protein